VIPLQNIQTIIFLVNLHGTPKLWAIAHKTALKRKNDEFFCHASQTCIECHGPCKSVRNRETVGNSS
jgi:hypothetical protein